MRRSPVLCASCKAPKWSRYDACANADCPKNTTTTVTHRPMTRPVALAMPHGFHAPTTVGFVATLRDYDRPISKSR